MHIYIYILFYYGVTPAGNNQRYYISRGVRRRGKTGIHGKVGVKRKWWVLAELPYSPQGNGMQSPRVEPFNQEDRPPYTEENPENQYSQRLGGQARP